MFPFLIVLNNHLFIAYLQTRVSHFFPSIVQKKTPSLKTVEKYRQVKVRFVPVKTRHPPFGCKDKSTEIWMGLEQLANYDSSNLPEYHDSPKINKLHILNFVTITQKGYTRIIISVFILITHYRFEIWQQQSDL